MLTQGLVARSVARLVAGGPDIGPTSDTFFHEDLVMKIFMRPFFLFR